MGCHNCLCFETLTLILCIFRQDYPEKKKKEEKKDQTKKEKKKNRRGKKWKKKWKSSLNQLFLVAWEKAVDGNKQNDPATIQFGDNIKISFKFVW